MLRPLALDIAGFLLPLAIGVIAFLAGKTFRRWPTISRVAVVILTLVVVAGAAVDLTGSLPFHVSEFLTHLGGPTVLLCIVGLLLLGVGWAVPNRSFSSGFLLTIAAIALCLIGIESAGRIWWRLFANDMWQRTADAHGCLQQTSGMTCAPTAAVMLLHQYRVAASEGEMAYLAGTSLFGTDAPSMVAALNSKVEPRGWRAEARHGEYAECVRDGRPFIAHVHGPNLGHALLVERAAADHVEVIDPQDGRRRTLTREEFQGIWDGTAIRIVRPLE